MSYFNLSYFNCYKQAKVSYKGVKQRKEKHHKTLCLINAVSDSIPTSLSVVFLQFLFYEPHKNTSRDAHDVNEYASNTIYSFKSKRLKISFVYTAITLHNTFTRDAFKFVVIQFAKPVSTAFNIQIVYTALFQEALNIPEYSLPCL